MVRIFKQWYGRHKLLFRLITGLFVFYTLAGFAGVPLIIDHVLENQVSEALQRKVQATRIRSNPFAFSVRLVDVNVSEPDGSPFIHVDNLYVNADPLLSLFKWGAVLKSVEITSPRVRVARTGETRFNFSDLLNRPAQDAAADTGSQAKPIRFVLNMFKLISGEIEYNDTSRKTPFQSTVSQLDISLNGLDTRPDADAFSYGLSCRTESDEVLQVNGRSDLHPFSVESDVLLKGLVLTKYAPYYQPYLNAKITDGRIDLGAKARLSEQTRTVTDIVMAVADLAINDLPGEKNLVKLPVLEIKDARFDLNQRSIQLGRIHSTGGQVHIQRSAQGQLDLQAAFTPPASEASSPAVATDATPPAWELLLPELDLSNYSVSFEDLQPIPPARIDLHQIALSARNLSTQKQAEGTVDLKMQWADQGALSVQGDVGLIPLQAGLDVAVDAVDVRPLQPYLKQFAQLVITKGQFDAQGRLQIRPGEDSADIGYTGQAALNGFEAVDAEEAALFSKWKSLYLTGIDVGMAPLKVHVEKIALTDFYNRLYIDADGTANLETIFKQGQASASASSPSKPATEGGRQPADARAADIRIKTVTLQGGEVDFNDRHVKPNVQLAMKDLGGRVSGLDNIKKNRADVLLRGSVGSNVPMEIKGQVNPLIEKPYVDLNLTFPGIDLSPFTPYSGKYLGYTVEKGQLAFSLAYKIVDNKLVGQNKIQINQFAFGDTVSSPQATKLPVKLAVALLKDRKGDIDLDLPVKGDLDDPEFSMGGIILKMLGNLIVEIVSSPFKVLGAIFGGGEELAYLQFEPGLSEIAPEGMQKLDTLAKILYERPGLNLEIQGQVDPQKDTEGLRKLRFEENLKAEKLKSMVAAGRRAVPLDQIEITAQVREKMIQQAYQAATFPKPRDENGRLKALDPPEMEKLLYTAIAISSDDLRHLAFQRASAAKDYLLTTGKIAATRLFVTEPETDISGKQKDAKPQVAFNFK